MIKWIDIKDVSEDDQLMIKARLITLIALLVFEESRHGGLNECNKKGQELKKEYIECLDRGIQWGIEAMREAYNKCRLTASSDIPSSYLIPSIWLAQPPSEVIAFLSDG